MSNSEEVFHIATHFCCCFFIFCLYKLINVSLSYSDENQKQLGSVRLVLFVLLLSDVYLAITNRHANRLNNKNIFVTLKKLFLCQT